MKLAMTTDLAPSKKTSSNIVGGAAGAGGGTLLVLLANNLPEASSWKSWLVIVAPSMSVLISSTWLWTRGKIEEHLKNKEFNAIITDTKATLTDALDNPATSKTHKEDLIKELEQLEKFLIKKNLDRIKYQCHIREYKGDRSVFACLFRKINLSPFYL